MAEERSNMQETSLHPSGTVAGASVPLLRLFLAEDHAVVREGLKTLVNTQPEMEVIGEAGNGEETYRKIRVLSTEGNLPDVVLMDVSMPGGSGQEATTRLRRQWPSIKVLALSMHEDRSYLRALLEAGAAGYVLKRSAAEELIRAIHVVSQGGTYLDSNLTATVVETFMKRGQAGKTGLRGEISGAPLSEREESVLRLIAQGLSNKEIAAQLKVSIKTVETYKARSLEKLSLDSRADIIRYALTKGWLH